MLARNNKKKRSKNPALNRKARKITTLATKGDAVYLIESPYL